jgi:hypothetical protein
VCQASRALIRHAPITDQPAIQPTITEIIAQVGIGGMPRSPCPPVSAWPGPPAAAKAYHAEAQPAEHEEREEDQPDVVKTPFSRRRGNGGRPPDRAGRVMRDGLQVDNVHGTQRDRPAAGRHRARAAQIPVIPPTDAGGLSGGRCPIRRRGWRAGSGRGRPAWSGSGSRASWPWAVSHAAWRPARRWTGRVRPAPAPPARGR